MNAAHDQSNPLFAFLRRRWLPVVVMTAAAAAAAFVYATAAASLTYSFSAEMLYNRSQLGAPHYLQPEVQSIVGLFRSRAVLEPLAAEFRLPPALKPLSESIQTEVGIGSNAIQLTMRGEDPKRTKAQLDRLMQLVAEQAAALRRASVAKILGGLETHLADARRTADEAFDALHRFNAEHRIVTTVEDDLERLQEDVAAVERLAETDRPASLDPDELLQRRRTALEDQHDHHRESLDQQAAFALKQNEYERAAKLHAKRYISDAEFRRIETEYRTLAAQNDAAARARRERIARLDRALTERTDPTSRSAATTAAGDDPTHAALLARLNSFLEQRRAEVARLGELRAEAARLEQAVTSAQDEIRRTSTLIASYAEMRDTPFHDLAVVQPAAPSFDPVLSNKKKLLIGAWLAILCVLLGPTFCWDMVAAQRAAAAEADRGVVAKLPVLASIDAIGGDRTSVRTEVVRTLASRIQQLPSSRGVAVALNSCDADGSAIDAAIETAECLHRRGERVLIVEATGDADAARRLCEHSESVPLAEVTAVEDWMATSAPFGERYTAAAVFERPDTMTMTDVATDCGLAELLTDETLPVMNVVRRGASFNVLTLGASRLPDEAFASRRLTSLLDELRGRYGVVLLSGPGLNRSVDLELLAARVDALAFVSASGRSPSPAAEKTLANLVALQAPLLGVVEL